MQTAEIKGVTQTEIALHFQYTTAFLRLVKVLGRRTGTSASILLSYSIRRIKHVDLKIRHYLHVFVHIHSCNITIVTHMYVIHTQIHIHICVTIFKYM